MTSPAQLPSLLEQAVQSALARPGRRRADASGRRRRDSTPPGPAPRFASPRPRRPPPDADSLARAAAIIDESGPVTLLVGKGAHGGREEVLALAERLAAPMVLTLKAKEHLERENPYAVGQSGLIGNPAAQRAFERCEVLVVLGTDFPYSDWYPEGKRVIQIDSRTEHIGRRTARRARDRRRRQPQPRRSCSSSSPRRPTATISQTARSRLRRVAGASAQARRPGLRRPRRGREAALGIRQPRRPIRPEAVAAAVDRLAPDDTIFTTDTGMSTVWLSRFVTMRGTRRLIGSYNLGSMANAMPQALGAQALDRGRPVIAFCGDGGLTMLMGDLLTAVTHHLPVKLVVFNNGRLGMVKLEQEQAGLPEFGTELGDVDIAAIAPACGLHARARDRPARARRGHQLGARPPGPVTARRASPTPMRSRCPARSSRARRGDSRSPSSPRRLRAGANVAGHRGCRPARGKRMNGGPR